MGIPAPRWTDVLEYAQAAETAGFDSLWAVDHFLVDRAKVEEQMGRPVPESLRGQPLEGFWECWSLLASLASVTNRVELGTLVTATAYRNPALLVKIAETIDEVSGGRVILGIGAGDFQNEFEAYGYPWEKKVGRFEEAVQIITQLLREGRSDFSGEHYQVNNCELRPRGPRPGGMPVLIGALANRPRMLRLVMQYADIWNNWTAAGVSSPAEARRRFSFIAEACEKHDRDPASLQYSLTIGVSWSGPIFATDQPMTGESGEIAEQIHEISEIGYDHIQILPKPLNSESVERLAPVLEALRG
jgi:alkanesulfonate monooxygenase SsuD/methylene tetrahydromethanopterin reductase-like flavin-dependent oxidoreductase (luciferase family)